MTPAEQQRRRELNEKLERDLAGAATIAARTAKFAIKVAVTPKVELFKKFFRMVVNGEDD